MYYWCHFRMSTKLVKLDVPDRLHTRIKTLAASQDKKIQDYILEVLDQYVPREIKFSEPEETHPKDLRQKKSQGKFRGP